MGVTCLGHSGCSINASLYSKRPTNVVKSMPCDVSFDAFKPSSLPIIFSSLDQELLEERILASNILVLS